jgi:hypothetical protein
MPDVIQDVQHALLACDPYDGDGGVGCREEEVVFQAQRFGGVGVDYAAVRKGYHAAGLRFRRRLRRHAGGMLGNNL